MEHVWGRQEVRTGFWWENLRERVYLEELGVDWRMIRKFIFKK